MADQLQSSETWNATEHNTKPEDYERDTVMTSGAVNVSAGEDTGGAPKNKYNNWVTQLMTLYGGQVSKAK